jgi:hypothetical protein
MSDSRAVASGWCGAKFHTKITIVCRIIPIVIIENVGGNKTRHESRTFCIEDKKGIESDFGMWDADIKMSQSGSGTSLALPSNFPLYYLHIPIPPISRNKRPSK